MFSILIVLLIVYIIYTFKQSYLLSREVQILLLKQQLNYYKSIHKRSNKIPLSTKLFWIISSKYLKNWKDSLIIVSPDTVLKWHKDIVKLLWRIKSKNNSGRPRTSKNIIQLIKKLSNENPTWGAPRIHSELIHLGYHISESTVGRYIKNKKPPNELQTWRTFINNHFDEIVAIDFFTVPTIKFQYLHCFVAIDLSTRKIIHYNTTYNTTEWWVVQQLRDFIPDNHHIKYIIRDNGSYYSSLYRSTLQSMNIKDMPTSIKSPWQNGYCERVIGSIKRELFDHVIVINQAHAKRLLSNYISYYNNQRPHLGLKKEAPNPRPKQFVGKIKSIDINNGLNKVYYRDYKNKNSLKKAS